MNQLHTHARRLVAAGLLVGGIGLASVLTLPARSANSHSSSSTGYVATYYHQATPLGSRTIAGGSGLDVVWKDTICSNGYGSPPVAAVWIDSSTGAASRPVMGPCGHAPGESRIKGPDDFRCDVTLSPPSINCYWTWKGSSGSAATAAKIAKGGYAETMWLDLYRRTALYAYVITPGKPAVKVSVPAGTDAIKFAPAP